MPLKTAIDRVINGRSLSFDEAAAAMDVIMDGAATPASLPAPASVAWAAVGAGVHTGVGSASESGMGSGRAPLSSASDFAATSAPGVRRIARCAFVTATATASASGSLSCVTAPSGGASVMRSTSRGVSPSIRRSTVARAPCRPEPRSATLVPSRKKGKACSTTSACSVS